MTTRGKLLRCTGTPNFHGQVHKWKRAWVFMGDENAAAAKKKIKLLKWIQTDERAEVLKGPNFPHLIPVDKETSPIMETPHQKDQKTDISKINMEEEKIKIEEEDIDEAPSYKNGSITTGDFVDLGFNELETEDADQTEMKSSELSDREKESMDPLSRDEVDSSSLGNGSESSGTSDEDIRSFPDTQTDT